MARAGRGTSCFVEDGAPESLRVKVLGQLKQSLQPALDDVSIEWKFPKQVKQYTADIAKSPPVKTLLGYKSPLIEQQTERQHLVPMYPSQNPPIFNKEKFLSYAMFPRDSAQPIGVVVRCATRDGPLTFDIPISGNEVYQGAIAKKLAARIALGEFEEKPKQRSGSHQRSSVGEISESEALQLALSNGLASSLTSFIAVRDDVVVDARVPVETKVVPQTRFRRPRLMMAAASVPDHRLKSRAACFRLAGSPLVKAAAVQSPGRNPRGASAAVGDPAMFRDQRCAPASPDFSERLALPGAKKRSKTFTAKVCGSKSPPADPVLLICLQQNANGEFVWNADLVAALGLDNHQVKSLHECLGSPDQKWFGTALAVAVLRRSFAAQRSVWELQEAKALQVLQNTADQSLLLFILEEEVAKMIPQSV